MSKIKRKEMYETMFNLKEDTVLQKIEVLLADDNREFTNLLAEYISEQEDMEVTGIAYNGEEVLQLLEQTRDVPDVLILDIIMPHLDGLGVLERLRDLNLSPQPKVIMLTAFGQENITQQPCNSELLIIFLSRLTWKCLRIVCVNWWEHRRRCPQAADHPCS